MSGTDTPLNNVRIDLCGYPWCRDVQSGKSGSTGEVAKQFCQLADISTAALPSSGGARISVLGTCNARIRMTQGCIGACVKRPAVRLEHRERTLKVTVETGDALMAALERFLGAEAPGSSARECGK